MVQDPICKLHHLPFRNLDKCFPRNGAVSGIAFDLDDRPERVSFRHTPKRHRNQNEESQIQSEARFEPHIQLSSFDRVFFTSEFSFEAIMICAALFPNLSVMIVRFEKKRIVRFM